MVGEQVHMMANIRMTVTNVLLLINGGEIISCK